MTCICIACLKSDTACFACNWTVHVNGKRSGCIGLYCIALNWCWSGMSLFCPLWISFALQVPHTTSRGNFAFDFFMTSCEVLLSRAPQWALTKSRLSDLSCGLANHCRISVSNFSVYPAIVPLFQWSFLSFLQQCCALFVKHPAVGAFNFLRINYQVRNRSRCRNKWSFPLSLPSPKEIADSIDGSCSSFCSQFVCRAGIAIAK